MKLTPASVHRVLNQFGERAILDHDPLMPRFREVFGDHTYFLDESGLKIIESAHSESGDIEVGRVVKLASWIDESRTKLAPHEHEFTGVLVTLSEAA
jgi:hypothetical protein